MMRKANKFKSAARQLNYIPDLSAGTLASQRSGHVAVLLPTLRHAGFLRTVDGLSDTLREHGYHLLIGDCYYSTEQQTDLLRLLLGRRPETIVLVTGLDSSAARELLKNADIPIFEIWYWPENSDTLVVKFSQFDAGFALTDSLICQGYREIDFLGGPAQNDPNAEQRLLGHIAALQKAGLRTDIHGISGNALMDIEDAANGLSELLQHFRAMDALACASDMIHRNLDFEIIHRHSTDGEATTNLNLSSANDELLMVGVSSRL